VAKVMFYKETNFKETPVGKIPKDWEVVKLGDERVSELVKSGLTPLKKIKEYWNGNIPFVTIGDMTKVEHYLYETSEKITTKALKDNNLLLIPKNSILLSMYGTIGKVLINKIPVVVSQNIAAIIPAKDINEEYLLFALQKYSFQFRRTKIITLKHLDIKIVKNCLLPLPHFPEQQVIAQILLTIDEAIQKTNEVIAKTERLKKGLMQELLTKGLILGFMFDTNIFDKILDEKIELPKNLKYYVTHIQYDEILNIPMDKKERGERLLKIFNKIPKEVIATEGAAIEVSRFDLSKLMSKEDAELYDKMLKKLEELDEKPGKKKTPENQARDILIALTCMKNCLTLVTNDNNLKKVAQEFQCSAITFEQLLKGEYREFKDTEIGMIPKEWEVVKIGNIGSFQYGLTVSATSKETGIRLLRITDIKDYGISWESMPHCEITEEDFRKYSLKFGDILFARIGATTGKTCFIDRDDVKAIFGSYLIRFLPYIKINTQFLFQYAQSLIYWNQVNRIKEGQLKKGLNTKTLASLLLPFPLLSEQQKIAEVLSTVDKKLELERNEKARLERIKQGLMGLLLTGKIRVKVT
jgi:restriction endonuclease S subunit